jgi:gamma-glutamyltranspeptidase/glutathione hydrolase
MKAYRHSVVASGHPSVSQAAAEILRAGGNAFDAAIAAGFASAIAEPALTSLGGGGFLLAREESGRSTLFDFFVDTPGRDASEAPEDPHFLPITVHFPSSDQIFNTGRASAAVPGILKGYLHVQRRLGRIPLREVLQPAIALARDGVLVNSHQGYFLGLLRPIMTLSAEGRALFAPEGRLLAEGDRLRNAQLADFLECLPSEGDREFYCGALARCIAHDMREGKGLLGESDLAAYRVREGPPLEAAYRGHRLLTNQPPSFGGSLLVLSLALLEGATPAAPKPGSPEDVLSLLAVMEEVDELRRAGRISLEGLGGGERAAVETRLRVFTRGTTHVSVCDAEGNVASMSTSNGEGSGYLVPGTGIMLNNMLGEDDLHPDGFHAGPPGERVASMMSPTLLLRDDEVRLVIGSGGSKRIRTALLQVIRLVAGFDLDVARAVEHPRLHWDGEQVQIEPGFGADALAALRGRRPVNEWEARNVYFGGVNACVPGREGAGDPRRGGSTLRVDAV